jgi:hypothetical protein
MRGADYSKAEVTMVALAMQKSRRRAGDGKHVIAEWYSVIIRSTMSAAGALKALAITVTFTS